MPRKFSPARVLCVSAMLLTGPYSIANSLAADRPASDVAMTAGNPFAQPSPLPYQTPPFDHIHAGDYWPAFVEGMKEQRREVDSIAHSAAPPSFDNTIVALERSGRLLERVGHVFFLLVQSMGDEPMLKLEEKITPALAAHQDAIHLDRALFVRIDTVYRERTQLGLDPESLQLLTRYHTDFERAGAGLGPARQQRLRALDQQISMLSTKFRQNVLKSTQDSAVVVEQLSQLEGLSPQQLAAAADAAKERGLQGKWLIALENTTTQPLLAQLTDRALRERIYRASIARATSGPTDNRVLIVRLVKKRAERAKLLGYPDHATYVLADDAAGDPVTARGILLQIDQAALPVAHREADDIQQLINQDAALPGQPAFTLQPWDWQFYAERVRKSKYDFDQEQVKPYFELDHVLKDGLFYAAHELYGITFKERTDLPVYQKDVRVFEVFDRDGDPLGLFMADYYARDGKQGGAWDDNFVQQSQLLDQKTVFVNNLNIVKPPEGSPTLLTFDEVTSMFHEFGHGLHGLFSNVRYPLLAANNVATDFVEYPSQYNEMWAREPAVVAHFAHHYQTGKALPQALLDRILAAQVFDQGYLGSEYIQASLIDLAWHGLDAGKVPDAAHVPAFEASVLRESGASFAPIPPRYHSTYFLHIFGGGYDAGYFAYLWSEVLARDTGQWIHAHGGLTRANGDYFRDKVLSRGRSADAQQLFRDFYGAPPDVKPLLEYRGLE